MKPIQAEERATALIITMLVIFLIAVAIGISMNMTTATVRQTDASRDFSALRSAAEGALEFGYGIWVKKINSDYRPVKNSDLNNGIGSGPVLPAGISYVPATPQRPEGGQLRLQGTDQYARPFASPGAAATPPPTRLNLKDYPGWVGTNSSYVANVRMQSVLPGNRTVEYGVKRTINYTVVPLFQATAFFEDDLELYRTAPMTIGGLVHTNNKAYVSSQVDPTKGTPSLTFSGNLSYAGEYIDGKWKDANNVERDAPPEAWNWSGYVPNNSFEPGYSNGGKDNQVADVKRIEPLGADAKTLLHPPEFDPVTGVPKTSADVNANDDSMREMIEPPNTYVNPITQKITSAAAAKDEEAIADRRLYTKAGIRVRVSGSSYTITTNNGTKLTPAQVNALKSALSQQTIYDRREAKWVDVTTLDISRAKANVSPGVPGPLSVPSFNNIIYLDDLGATSYTDPKAIRLKEGQSLPPDGLTVATQNALYIEGDYNTTNQSTRGSAAVFADSVTILSNNWSDSKSDDSLNDRRASDTKVNTAIVAGFLPSGWKNPKTGNEYEYSGGLNNFPRFLENWDNKKFTYTGSMIQLFTSQIATGEWDTGSIYAPPDRIWDFDTNFFDNPPPGSLDAVYIGRGPLARY